MGVAAKKIDPINNAPNEQSQWNRRVLVVEDEREIASSYRDILCANDKSASAVRSSRQAHVVEGATDNEFRFELVMVHNVQDALAEVRKACHHGRPFAMGFFDVRLGGRMDGYELVKEIQGIDPYMYAVFVTAYNDRSIDSIHKYLGKDRVDHWDYLNKPFSTGEIQQKARNFISIWNLRREKERHEEQLALAHMHLLDSEKMAAVTTVARGMGHEFGNILMQIMGRADISLEKNESEMREALEAILEATQKASQVLDRFKDLASGQRVGDSKELLDPMEVVDSALALMEHQLRSKSIKVCHIKHDPVVVAIDSTALLQVIINVVINSLHAMGDGGQLDVSVVDLGKFVEVRLRDYGPGIDDKLIPQVTNAFFTTKGNEGTGLGLAICKEIVEIEHGGDFIVQSPAGKGVEIVLRLNKKEG